MDYGAEEAFWAMVRQGCGYAEEEPDLDRELRQKKQKDASPISIRKLTPIQMPHIDIEKVRAGRKAFTQDEWMDVMLRSCGSGRDQHQWNDLEGRRTCQQLAGLPR